MNVNDQSSAVIGALLISNSFLFLNKKHLFINKVLFHSTDLLVLTSIIPVVYQLSERKGLKFQCFYNSHVTNQLKMVKAFKILSKGIHDNFQHNITRVNDIK